MADEPNQEDLEYEVAMDDEEGHDGLADGDSDEEDEEEMEDGGGEQGSKKGKQQKQVFLPGDEMEEGEELTFDSSAYELYHSAQTGAPCLSFDVLPDSLGDSRTEYPMTMYIVSGTQAELGKQNQVIVMKMSELNKTNNGDDSDSDDETLDDEPELNTAMIKHNGGVNRIRHAPIPDRHLVASWSDKGKVHIWEIAQQLLAVDNPLTSQAIHSREYKPTYTFTGHQTEGFAMDWSRTVKGRLLTGDCRRNIHLWTPQEGGTWHVDQRAYRAHTDSVEDLQWSPNEQNVRLETVSRATTVFASCSVDKTVRIWDARAAPSKACMLTTQAHDADVNVISWNRNEPFIASGGDDGILKIWDLRQFQKGVSVAVFKHHTAPMTSVEWHPTDSSVFVASGADNQVTLWDLAVERDDRKEGPGKHLDVPPQLLFIHMGQKDIKEVHWHPQLPGLLISTAATGFNIFKTISV